MLAAVFTTLVAFSASAFAYTTPTTFNVTSNPVFTPNAGDIVPAGKPYTIKWGPSEAGTVSIILLRGPSTNILPLYPIVEKIPNTGSYVWTPKSDLQPDTTHYGIQIIIDANGQYQYSTQFGVSNANYVSSASSSAAATSSAASSSASGSAYPTASTTKSEPTTTSYATVYSTTKSTVVSVVTVATSSSTLATVSYVPTVAPTYGHNGTQPTMSIPPLPSATGAASSIKVGGGLLAAVAGVAAMLL
ncbi:hypothetical protein Dda_1676 [Drechslerella dactyloides]|uniref:Yeast cell wall synthesis Kre9/Knh1-like N-terminal domain-containing protein n=1 Tax=Drechslerella dactyloides TaxID=74499 RepID=A0AAD6J3H8_DREDA|nr:hypothetical protein Dda_1676 [Drechslerella dactyloides]